MMEVDVIGEAIPVFQTNGLAHHKGDGRGLHLPNNLGETDPHR